MDNSKNHHRKDRSHKGKIPSDTRLYRRVQRRLQFKWKLWMWRKKKIKCGFMMFRREARKHVAGSDPSRDPETQNRKLPMNTVNVNVENTAQKQQSSTKTTGNVVEIPQRSTRGPGVAETIKETENCPSEQHTFESQDRQDESPESDVCLQALTEEIHDFIDNFLKKYGSFIPFQKSDVFQHLKTKFNKDLSDRTDPIFSEVNRYRDEVAQNLPRSFSVIYKKHTLSLGDLFTLADQNWINDQIINMYGVLLMEFAQHKVHFLNSFFYSQLLMKGYDGVKRWTKEVDLFSKTLLLVPIHLCVHWCLVTADFTTKKIYLYDSQGHAFQQIARNIQIYLVKEAQEKQKGAFTDGWTLWLVEKLPQQTNVNDCGPFVLEYCRCLALEKPLRFSQKDIPEIRRRIYKELCDCKLHKEE